MTAKLLGKIQIDLHGSMTSFSPGYYPEYTPGDIHKHLKQGFSRSEHVVTVYLSWDHQESEIAVFEGEPPGSLLADRAFAIPVVLDHTRLQFDSSIEDYWGELGIELNPGRYLLKIFHKDLDEIGEYGTPKARIEVFVSACSKAEIARVLIAAENMWLGDEFVKVQSEDFSEWKWLD